MQTMTMININLEQEYECMFTMNNTCGFKRGHRYYIMIFESDTKNGYLVTASFDITENKEINIEIPLSSEASIERYFTLDKVNY